MSGSKKEKLVYDLGCDRLSELPSSIISGILSSVSTRDAVRMSILSRQFRYEWIGLPHLVFDLSEFGSKECMEKFVTNVLKLHKGPIHKFEMSAVLEQNWPIVDEWLLFLPRDEIRELTVKLGFEGEARHQVRSIVYSCNKLTYLELCGRCILGPPPLTFTGFLFLRRLILVFVTVSLNDIESIVANSPLLESLKLDYYASYDDDDDDDDDTDTIPKLKISAPNLKDLYFESNRGDCMELYLCAPRLTEICITIEDENYLLDLDLQQENSSVCNYANFLGGCASLEKLRGDMHFTKVLSFGIDSCRDSFVLHHLKAIELHNVNFFDLKETEVIARLMTDAPNLEMLKIRFDNISGIEADDLTPDFSDMKFLRAPNFKWEKLKVITMINTSDLPSEIQFLKLLLENSPVLETMTHHTDSILDSDEVKDLREELLKCDIASPNFTLCTDTVGA